VHGEKKQEKPTSVGENVLVKAGLVRNCVASEMLI